MSAASAFEGAPDREEGAPGGSSLASFAALLALMLIEVLDGRRPAEQLDPLVTSAVALRIRHWLRISTARRRRAATGPEPAPRVRSVRCQRHCDDAAESAVVIEHRGRTRAIAVRLDRCNGVWLATDLAPAEGGLPALATSSLRAVPPPRDAFDEAAAANEVDPSDPTGDEDASGPADATEVGADATDA